MVSKSHGYSDVLIGLQYGDEGKAKIIDILSPNYDIVARFNGGPNAGHTVCTEKGSVSLRQIPSAIFHDSMLLYIGSGCVNSISMLNNELDQCEALKIDLTNRLIISGQVSIIQPHHILLDNLLHEKIGTTGRGIGPCYADRALRMADGRLLNLQMAHLKENPEECFAMMRANLQETQKRYNLPSDAGLEELENNISGAKRILKFIAPDPLTLQRLVSKGKNVLFEGAQSIMLDVSRGTIPFVTSSQTTVGHAYVGGDLSPKHHRYTFGIAKAIMSRVGNGPFVSEYGGKASEEYCATALAKGINRETESRDDAVKLLGSDNSLDIAKGLRIVSAEYGTGTKRPRRIGSLDLVQLKHAIHQNSVDYLFLNKCDLLGAFRHTKKGKIPLTTGYITEKNEKIDYVPSTQHTAETLKPIVEEFEAFSDDVSHIRDFEKLPQALKTFLNKIESETGSKILGIGVGPNREEVVLTQALTLK